jgi:hypothetical protein
MQALQRKAAATTVFPAHRGKGGFVNTSRSTKSILLAAVILVATSGFAADKASLNLLDPTTVGGKHLPVGSYKLQWEGTGEQVELKIYQGKNVIATTPAHVVALERPVPSNAVGTARNADGSTSLTRIDFAGKKYALEITGASSAPGTTTAAK